MTCSLDTESEVGCCQANPQLFARLLPLCNHVYALALSHWKVSFFSPSWSIPQGCTDWISKFSPASNKSFTALIWLLMHPWQHVERKYIGRFESGRSKPSGPALINVSFTHVLGRVLSVIVQRAAWSGCAWTRDYTLLLVTPDEPRGGGKRRSVKVKKSLDSLCTGLGRITRNDPICPLSLLPLFLILCGHSSVTLYLM